MSISNFFSTSKGKITIAALIFVIIALSLSYYFMYGSSDAKFKRSIKQITSDIQKSNKEASSTYALMDKGSSEFDKIKSSIENSNKALDSSIKLLKSITPKENYKDLHNELLQGLNSNKMLFFQSIAILDNYSSDTVNDSIGKLYEYLSSTAGYYEKVSLRGYEIELSKEILNYPDKLKEYINTLKKNNLNTNANYDAQLSYISNIKEKIESITSLEKSCQEDITKGKNNKLNINQLLISISSKKNDLSSIIDSINALTVPSNVEDVKNLFTSTGVLYDDYLSALRSSIESSKEKDSVSIIDSSININKERLEEFNEKKSSLESLITEKENSFR